MRVKELIELLEQCDPDGEVLIYSQTGGTKGVYSVDEETTDECEETSVLIE